MGFKARAIILLIVCGLCMFSCGSSIENETELVAWVSNTDHGYIKKAKGNGFTLTMQYLPPEYLAYMEMKKDGEDKTMYDKYLKEFNQSTSFLFSLNHEDGHTSMLTYDVDSYSGYNQRVRQLNFDLKSALEMQLNDSLKVLPVLSSFENTYEIQAKNTLYIVFPKKTDQEIQKMDIIYRDPFFDTGISHFLFDKDKIQSLPTIKFSNRTS
ncbi:hypothetical protein JM658_12020 [Joostella atrarenae]|uniref:Lipoprotein n=1 Tax=Joostella atrarenae TaxID=679257 RepID=A0ABS9J553_9FLAO|nr:hypothetical protein [Joostella atrarenae]MCF8715552.1 hypothetical protein [Joostella atrarenae]